MARNQTTVKDSLSKHLGEPKDPHKDPDVTLLPDGRRQLRFKARTWGFLEDEDGSTIFYISGQTASERTVYAKVVGFQPNIIISIPQYAGGKEIKWNANMCDQLFQEIANPPRSGASRSNSFQVAPISYGTLYKENLYGKSPISAMNLVFRCASEAKKFVYNFRSRKSSMYVPGAGELFPSSFKFFDEMDPILKYTAIRSIQPAGWIEITETILPEEQNLTTNERKFSTTDINITANHDDLRPIVVDASVIVQPTYISFDIECNSRNHNSKIPDPTDPMNVIFQIGIVAGRLYNEKTRIIKLLTLFDPLPIEGVEIERFKTERALLIDGFAGFVNSFDGDVFIGYNIMKFDWDYMIKRAELGNYLPRFLKMSRLYGRSAEVKNVSWASSAYKNQEFRFPECHGRVNLDAIIEIERNYRLPTYSLNHVSGVFLGGEGKDDVTPIELFMCYKVTHEFLEASKHFTSDTDLRRVFYPAIREIMQKRKTHGEVRKLRRELLRCTHRNATLTIRKLLTVTGKYCVQDTVLSVKLVEKMNMWTVMQGMSNTMSVPLSFLHTRGQQIKVLSQIYRECIKDDIVIPMKEGKIVATEKYQGAIVVKAVPGVYELVGVLDFASLYPTTMIDFNIDYTTILRDDEKWPEHLTHVLEWEDHVGCEHDPKKRKKKAEDVLCRSRRYRFKKVEVVIHPDGRVEYKNEGLLPRLEKNLLTSRSAVKKELFKCEARLAMHLGKASEQDLAYYRKMGFEMIPAGYLNELEEINLRLTIGVYNAEQLAIKVSANCVSQTAPIPCLVDGKVVYRQIEDLFAVSFKESPLHQDSEGNQVCEGSPDTLVWSDAGWTNIKYIVRKPIDCQLTRVLTHTGCVDVTDEHSLLREDGTEVKTSDVRIGDSLLHFPVPLPEDTAFGRRNIRLIDFGNEEERHTYALGKIFARPPEEGDHHYQDLHTSRGEKKIPDHILNSSLRIRNAFFEGCKDENHSPGGNVVRVQSQLGAAQMVYLMKSLGYHARISFDSDMYVLSYEPFFESHSASHSEERAVRSEEEGRILTLEKVSACQYVYDIETVSHHFAAGIGDMIVHNSAYGGMGAQTGFIPFVAGAESVTAMGRKQITLTVDMLESQLGNVVVYGDTDSAMSQNGLTNPEAAINKTKADGKLITHKLKLWALGLPYDHAIISPIDGKPYTLDKIKPDPPSSSSPSSSSSQSTSEPSLYSCLDIEDKKLVLLYARLPLDLEFEKMYGVMMLLTMKRYFATIINEKGDVVGFDKKGCILSRRDNCGFLKKTYKKLADMIVMKKPGEPAFIKTPDAERTIMYTIYDRVHDLFTRQVPDSDLVIYIGIGALMDYAKKTEILNAKGEVIATPYVDCDGKPIEDVVGPLDPRLVYQNNPQCILALKMTRRGIILPSNIRLEFLYVENEHSIHQGDKAEDYSYYMENKSYLGLRPDLLHYVEKQFTLPIGELIDVLFPKENMMYLKLEKRFKDLIASPEMEDAKRQRLFRLKGKMNRPRPVGRFVDYDAWWSSRYSGVEYSDEEDYLCGWDVHLAERNTAETNQFTEKLICENRRQTFRDSSFDSYKTSGVLNLRAQYILDSSKNEDDIYKFDVMYSDYEAELIAVAGMWKHRQTLDRLYRQHGLQIRPSRRATQTGDGLAVGTEVMVFKPFAGYTKGHILRVVARTVVEERGKKKIYAFSLIDPLTNGIIEGISRDDIAPFYKKDGKILEDIVKFRTHYSRVVKDLNTAFGALSTSDVIMQE